MKKLTEEQRMLQGKALYEMVILLLNFQKEHYPQEYQAFMEENNRLKEKRLQKEKAQRLKRLKKKTGK